MSKRHNHDVIVDRISLSHEYEYVPIHMFLDGSNANPSNPLDRNNDDDDNDDYCIKALWS